VLIRFKQGDNMARIFLFIAAIGGFLSVTLGAFGTHDLKDQLSTDMLAVFRTGVHYQALHSLTLFGIGLLALQHPSRPLAWSGTLICMGMLLFSGSLYLLAISGNNSLGMITPVGGLALMGGWLLLGIAAWRIPGPRPR